MKKYIIILVQIFAAITLAFPQSVSNFNLQVALRTEHGTIMTNQQVDIRVTLLSETQGGSPVFTETHSTTTNSKGIANLKIGSIDSQGEFSTIPWHEQLLVMVEAKLPSDNSFTTINVSPLLSVPYALYTNSEIEGLGSLGETLWHNGEGWVSTSQIFVDPNKVEISAQEGRIIEEPIFVVRNSNNEIVFAVYESGVVAYVASPDETKGSRGGFAVGGLSDQGKSEGPQYMYIMPDEVQFNIKQTTKGNRGGFAVGGLSDQGKGTENFLIIHPDSVIININENALKGTRGGFAVGGLSDQGKGYTDWLRLNKDTTYIRTQALNLNQNVSVDENVSVGGNVGTIPLTDIDENTYNTVRIGNQIWMAQNLKVTHYRDGSPIITGLEEFEWIDTTLGAFTQYPSSYIDELSTDAEVVEAYGLLYNWYATADSRGLCPTGWVVPSAQDWNILTNNLGGTEIAGGTLKSRRTAGVNPHPRWESPNTGANNFSGFSGIPGGIYNPMGNFIYDLLGYSGLWWSKESIEDFAMLFGLEYEMVNALVSEEQKFNGLSVRCIKSDVTQPSVYLPYPQAVYPTTAYVAANITDNGGAPIQSKGFVWSINPLPSIEINQGIITLEPTANFEAEVNPLIPNTTYHVRAFATNKAGTTYSETIIFTTNDFENCGILTDIDNNEYSTIVINDQCWMRENLKTTKLNDGTPIGTDWETWGVPAYAPHPETIYGAAYNGHTMVVDNLCPAGWHIPSKSDFEKLINFLGGEEIAGKKLKSTGTIQAGTGLWEQPNEATNESGFTGLPAGVAYSQEFNGIGLNGFWWTKDVGEGQKKDKKSNEKSDSYYALSLNYYDTYATIQSGYITEGYSVRCIWGQGLPMVNEPTLSNVAISSINISSVVTGDGGDLETPLTARGFVIGLSPEVSIDDNVDHFSDPIIELGAYAHSFSGLQPSTLYYLKAYASNSVGTKYSEAVMVKTYKDIISDGEENTYFTTQIGDQEWMAQNLESTQYTNGEAIDYFDGLEGPPEGITNYYTFKPEPGENAVNHGNFYSYTVLADSRGICPTGWRLPFIEDWDILFAELGGPAIAGQKMKTPGNSGFGTWEPPNEGATNESGFTAEPAGLYSSFGYFNQNSCATFWSVSPSSTEPDKYLCVTLNAYNPDAQIENFGYNIQNSAEDALSIRCIKDTGLPIVKTYSVVNLTDISATSGGEINHEGNSAVLTVGLVWSTFEKPTLTENDGLTTESVNTTFTSEITGLQPNTKYYLRAYATNGDGTGYGNQITFTTASNGLPFEDFESGFFANEWVQGEPGWVIDSEIAAQGSFSARSADINDNEASSLSIIFKTIGGNISFLAKISSEEGYDYLRLLVNGEEYMSISGEYDWQEFSYEIPAGFNTITWEYSKDFTSSSGQDCAWIDSITFPPTQYAEVAIGNQIWMAKNLNVTTYTNGDPINWIPPGSVPDPDIPYYTNHPLIDQYDYDYGKVYSFGVINDPRGICPVGWRIPDDIDWTELFETLGGVAVAGGKLKAVDMGLDGLWDFPNEGATNESGFSAFPAGYQGASGYYYGTPSGDPQKAWFWSATQVSATQNAVYYLSHDSQEVLYIDMLGSDGGREDAVSVRCIKEQ